jgi:hypothetical protein
MRGVRSVVAVASAAMVCSWGKANAGENLELSTLNQKRAIWEDHGLESYNYFYQLNCFCVAESVRPVKIAVEGGVVVSVLDTETGQNLDIARFQTVNYLFDQLNFYVVDQSDVVLADFDPALGYPVSVYVDPDIGLYDEEFSYVASDVTSAPEPSSAMCHLSAILALALIVATRDRELAAAID